MSGQVIHLTDQNFKKEVLEAKGPVLVDFWASWCGPCKMLTPVIEKLAERNDGKATVAKLSTEEHPEIAQQFGISAIPTVLIFKKGQIAQQFVGVRNLSEYQQALDSLNAESCGCECNPA